MKEIFTMWKNTQMVVLVSVSAAVYAALLIPFKVATIIPGFTEVRPAIVLPIVFSFLFGPAGAWGAAFGNLIGDFFGTLGLGSIFGLFGNFLYGYLPYKVWRCISQEDPIPTGLRLIRYIGVVSLASSVCGVFIGWGVDLLGFVPFSALGNIITLNNLVISSVLGPPLLVLLYPRVKRWHLLYTDILGEDKLPSPYCKIGLVLVIIGGFGGLILGNIVSIGLYKSGFLQAGFIEGTKGSLGVGLGLLPAIGLIVIGTLLL